MHPETRELAAAMRDFGLAVLGRAAKDSTFSEMAAPHVHALAVALAAQGAEIVLKARIAEEHPLLIFTRIPEAPDQSSMLEIDHLLEHGRTHQYVDLPRLLWATTGERMSPGAVSHYEEFGRLRNTVVTSVRPVVIFLATRCVSSSRSWSHLCGDSGM